jgi:hypothetical protein
MKIYIDKEYLFQRKCNSKLYIMKHTLDQSKLFDAPLSYNGQNYICTKDSWRKISVEKFNDMGFEYICKL